MSGIIPIPNQPQEPQNCPVCIEPLTREDAASGNVYSHIGGEMHPLHKQCISDLYDHHIRQNQQGGPLCPSCRAPMASDHPFPPGFSWRSGIKVSLFTGVFTMATSLALGAMCNPTDSISPSVAGIMGTVGAAASLQRETLRQAISGCAGIIATALALNASSQLGARIMVEALAAGVQRVQETATTIAAAGAALLLVNGQMGRGIIGTSGLLSILSYGMATACEYGIKAFSQFLENACVTVINLSTASLIGVLIGTIISSQPLRENIMGINPALEPIARQTIAYGTLAASVLGLVGYLAFQEDSSNSISNFAMSTALAWIASLVAGINLISHNWNR